MKCASFYVFGGYKDKTTPTPNTVFSFRVSPDGGTSPFGADLELPVGVADSIPVATDTNVYVFPSSAGAVNIAGIHDVGLGAWQSQTLSGAGTIDYGAAARVADHVFWFGLGTRSLMATIQPDGMLDGWQTLPGPSPITIAQAVPELVSVAQRLYIVGHTNGRDASSNAVFVADVAGDGTIGTWRQTEPFPTARMHYFGYARDGFMYVLGGKSLAGKTITDVFFAKILPDGTLDLSKPTTPLPAWRSFNFGIAVP